MKTPPRYSYTPFIWITLVLALLKASDLVDITWWTVTFWIWAPGVALCLLVGASAFLCFFFWATRIEDKK